LISGLGFYPESREQMNAFVVSIPLISGLGFYAALFAAIAFLLVSQSL